MDGFTIKDSSQNIFVCREMGVFDRLTNQTISHFFKLPPRRQLTDDQLRCIYYCTNYVHGLVYHNYEIQNVKMLPQDQVEAIFIELSTIAAKTNHLIAFKGGVVELNVIKKCKIYNYVDLEKLGCLKFDNLLNEYGRTFLKTCGNHKPLKNKKEAHCPTAEVCYFNQWCNLNL